MTSIFAEYRRNMRLFSRDVWMYLLAAALLGLSYFGFVTVLLNLYLLRLGYGTEFIGLVNGSTALAFAICSVPSGAIGSRWGYRRAAVVGLLLVSIGTILLPLAEFLPDVWRDTGIIVTRLLSGMGFALYVVNANPYLVAATGPKERSYVFSMQVALLPLAGFVGSLIAGILPEVLASAMGVSLDDPAPYRYPLILGGVLLIPAAYALYTTNEASFSSESTGSAPRAASAPYVIIAVLAVTAMLRMAGEGAARTFFNVYLDAGLGISTGRIGLLTAFGQVWAGPAALAAPMLILRLGKVPAIVLSTLGTAGSLLLMGSIPNWAIIGLGFMGVIGMRAITQSVINMFQMEVVSPGWRGVTSGVTSMAMGIGFTSMALGGGYLIPIVGYSGLFFIAAGLAVASALIFWVYFRIPRGEFAHSEYAQPKTASASP